MSSPEQRWRHADHVAGGVPEVPYQFNDPPEDEATGQATVTPRRMLQLMPEFVCTCPPPDGGLISDDEVYRSTCTGRFYRWHVGLPTIYDSEEDCE